MSTYLVAFLISDFKTQDKVSENIPHRIISNPLMDQTVWFALGNSYPILNGFIKYLNVSYTLPKLDHAAIPGFKGGGECRVYIYLFNRIQKNLILKQWKTGDSSPIVSHIYCLIKTFIVSKGKRTSFR